MPTLTNNWRKPVGEASNTEAIRRARLLALGKQEPHADEQEEKPATKEGDGEEPSAKKRRVEEDAAGGGAGATTTVATATAVTVATVATFGDVAVIDLTADDE
jgi:hypothetical protein